MNDQQRELVIGLVKEGVSHRKISKQIGVPRSTIGDYVRGVFGEKTSTKVNVVTKEKKPKILVIDIESAPILGHVWSLWNNNLGLNQVQQDWHLLSFAAKWYGDDPSKVIYMDQQDAVNIEDDKAMCVVISDLIRQSDFILAQNGKRFDKKKIAARMVINGLPPMKPVKVIDTLLLAKEEFGFTSNKLEYMTDKLCTKYKKLKHTKFAGHTLWTECLKGNPEAWDEMEEYNIHDILSLEELYDVLKGWSTKHPNTPIFGENNSLTCRICGSENLQQHGHWYTNLSKFPLYQCECGAWSRGRKTSTTKEEREMLTAAPL